MYVINKLYTAFKYSCNGLKDAWLNQWAFRFEIAILIIAIPLTFLIGRSSVEYAILISSVFLLLIVELLNSAIETTVNRISMERHELSGLAKDLASAAIMLTGVNAAIIWSIFIIARLF